MIGIKFISYYLGERNIDNVQKGISFGVEKEFIENKIGIRQIKQRLDNQSTADIASQAMLELFQESELSPNQVECLILITQNPDSGGLPHTSATLHHRHNLPKDCAVFDISLGCSGYVYGLSVIQSFMITNKIENGILVTCDPYSKIIDQKDKNTSLLFGDGATATWLSPQSPVWHLGKFNFGTDGEGGDSLKLQDNGLLHMNGRAVFNFSAINIPNSIKKTIKLNNSSLEEIDQIILHQGSKYIVDTIGKRIKAAEKTPFFAAEYGNLVSSSIPTILASEDLSSYKKILISGFGVGLSWASTILSR